jgi:dolichol-phosphate mannosyltransferase
MTTQPMLLCQSQHIRVGVIIPVYGESDSVIWILSHFPSGSVNTICLVIDMPLRSFMGAIRERAGQVGIRVHLIKNPRRMGIGYSIRQGLDYLQHTRHDVAVVMAGNGKDDPSEISRLIEPVASGEYDYVQGSRYLLGGRRVRTPLFRMAFNRIFPALWSMITGKRCTDVTNGYRCYRLDLIRDSRVNLNQSWLDGYSLEYYLHYKALTLRYRTREVPVSKIYPYRNRGGYSKIQPLKDWWPILSPLILLFLGVKE